jgi:hypothetical protein
MSAKQIVAFAIVSVLMITVAAVAGETGNHWLIWAAGGILSAIGAISLVGSRLRHRD